ncbi:hypothetical protein [Deinococcus sp. AJ005]|uniref:hypothetical protein n=1 Tax=Deinococcus sp. AJ005 TaxID=2652443 RepID=UPI00125CBAC7|nr:hypothetical protein [Deinococcus sp. AJ005]QFP75305.1 hypothetical protein DAAJ005_01805 [Deinococcus sp. AJ005]
MAHAYQVNGSEGRFLLKLLPGTPSGLVAAQRVATEIPLLAALREEGILTRIPQPRLTLDGAAMTRIHGFSAILYDWIDA